MYSFVNNKPKNLPSCVTAIPTLIDQYLPPLWLQAECVAAAVFIFTPYLDVKSSGCKIL